jgi:hypothetical protein
MKKAVNSDLTSFADHLDQQYGKRGTVDRERFEEGFEALKLGVMLQELRKKKRNDTGRIGQKMRYNKNLYLTN